MRGLKLFLAITIPRLLRWFGFSPFENHPIVVVGISGSGHIEIAQSLAALLGRSFIDAERYQQSCRCPDRCSCRERRLSDVIERLYRAGDNDERVVIALDALTADEQARVQAALPVTFVGVAIDEATLRSRYQVPGISPATRLVLEVLFSGPLVATVATAIICTGCYALAWSAFPDWAWWQFRPLIMFLVVLLAFPLWPLLCVGYDGYVGGSENFHQLFPPVKQSTGDPSRWLNDDLLRFQLPRGNGSYQVSGTLWPPLAARILVAKVIAASSRGGRRHG